MLIYRRVIGTFARVWLVRLANPAEEDRDKVYALKVLRKAEGETSGIKGN
jgi:hypothetical protein